MKKLVLLVAGIMIIAIAQVNAKKLPAVAAKLPVEFKQEIVKNLDYPSFAELNQIEGEVWMRVIVSDNSRLSVVDLSATNQELGNYVRTELTDMLVQNSSMIRGEVYYLKVKFDLLNKK